MNWTDQADRLGPTGVGPTRSRRRGQETPALSSPGGRVSPSRETSRLSASRALTGTSPRIVGYDRRPWWERYDLAFNAVMITLSALLAIAVVAIQVVRWMHQL